MNTFLMFVWSFIIRAMPFKRIATGVLCAMIFLGSAFIALNYITDTPENGILLIKSGGE